jgi:hypothetical protein
VGLTELGTKINSILPALPLSDLLLLLEETFDSTICNSSFIQNLKYLLLHQFHYRHFAKWLPAEWVMDYGKMVIPFCPRSMVPVPSMISLFRYRHKMTHRAPNGMGKNIRIYTGPIKMKLRLSPSTSPIDVDRSRLMLH